MRTDTESTLIFYFVCQCWGAVFAAGAVEEVEAAAVEGGFGIRVGSAFSMIQGCLRTSRRGRRRLGLCWSNCMRESIILSAYRQVSSLQLSQCCIRGLIRNQGIWAWGGCTVQRKIFKGENFHRSVGSDHFVEKTFTGMLNLVEHAQISWTQKTFAGGYQTAKFVNVFQESFPLYSIIP